MAAPAASRARASPAVRPAPRVGAFVLCLASACGARQEDAPGDAASMSGEETFELTSKVFEVEEIYRSMLGPRQGRNVRLAPDAPDELVWITGFRARMVGADGATPMSDEFMCHSNFDLKEAKAGGRLKKDVDLPRTLISPRLFTLSQGHLEIHFPPGFGIPSRGKEPFFVQMQVLNLNHRDPDFAVRHRLEVDYRRHDSDVPMKPLFVTTAYALVSLGGESATWNYTQDRLPMDEEVSCLPGHMASRDTLLVDGVGNRFSGHFVVPPGRHTFRTLATDLMALPFDTTVHYIAVHVHPYSETLTLRDLTTGEVVFESRAASFEDRVGVERVETYSSVEGIPVYADHEYEIVSVYDNTSGEDQDSMAVLLLYCLDRRFQEGFGG